MEGRYNALHRAYTDTGTLSPEAWSEMSSIYERLLPTMEAEAAQYEAETQPAIRAYTPTTQEAVAGYIGDRLSGVLPNSSYRVGHRVSNLLDLLPGTGTLMAGDQARRDYNEGSYGSAALNAGFAALDALPFVGAAARAIPSDAIYAGRSLLEGDPRGLLEAVSPTRPRQSLSAMRADNPGGRRLEGKTPAQEIARLLREGRASEVSDDLYAAADPQELHRLYETGATGADMPMDTTSRMARAEEAGFDADTPLYHGGDGFGLDVNFKYPAPVYVADETFGASEYALDRGGDDAQVAPLVARMGKIADGDEVLRVWEDVSGRSRDGLDYQFGWVPLNDTYSDHTSQVHQGLLDRGYDTAYFDDDFTPDGEVIESYALLNPVSNIRSRFARFDPRLSHLRNLSSGVAGAGAVGLGLLSQQPSQSEVEQYLAERGLLQ